MTAQDHFGNILNRGDRVLIHPSVLLGKSCGYEHGVLYTVYSVSNNNSIQTIDPKDQHINGWLSRFFVKVTKTNGHLPEWL